MKSISLGLGPKSSNASGCLEMPSDSPTLRCATAVVAAVFLFYFSFLYETDKPKSKCNRPCHVRFT